MGRPSPLFDTRLRRLRQATGRGDPSRHDDIMRELASRLLDRLDDVRRTFGRILVIGRADDTLLHGLVRRYDGCRVTRLGVHDTGCGDASHVTGDASLLPFRDSAFDLVLCVMEHHAVEDLPGSLVQIRRVLSPDGLMVSVFPGGETLAELRLSLIQAEIAMASGVTARTLPPVDIRDAGALLQRAGFGLPVADVDRLHLTYPDPLAAIAELRSLGETNCLRETARRPIVRAVLGRWLEICAGEFADRRGRFQMTLDLLFLTGWAPHESQQQALAPGSAVLRLVDALKPGGEG